MGRQKDGYEGWQESLQTASVADPEKLRLQHMLRRHAEEIIGFLDARTTTRTRTRRRTTRRNEENAALREICRSKDCRS